MSEARGIINTHLTSAEQMSDSLDNLVTMHATDVAEIKRKMELQSIDIAHNMSEIVNIEAGIRTFADQATARIKGIEDAAKDAEVYVDPTTKKYTIDVPKLKNKFRSSDNTITIQEKSGKIDLKAVIPPIPEGATLKAKVSTQSTYTDISKINVSNQYAVINGDELHLPVISAEDLAGNSLGQIRNLKAGSGVALTSNGSGDIVINSTASMEGKAENNEEISQHEYELITKIDPKSPNSSVAAGILTIGGVRALDKNGHAILSDTNGFIGDLKAGSGIVMSSTGDHGEIAISSMAPTGGYTVKARAGTDTITQRVNKIWAENAEFQDSNYTLKIKSIVGTVGVNSAPIKNIAVVGNTTGTSINSNGTLTINIPDGASGHRVLGVQVSGKDFDVESAPDGTPVGMTTQKVNFGDTLDTTIETSDTGSFVTVNARGMKFVTGSTPLAHDVTELEIEGALVTQADPKSGKAKLTIAGGGSHSGIEKGRYSVLTTVNDFKIGDMTASSTLRYQLVQDPFANIQLDNEGGFQVDVTAQYNVCVGIQLTGQNDYPDHSGTFHIEIQERQSTAGSYVTIAQASGRVTADGVGEFHGKYPLMEAKFDSTSLHSGRSYRICFSANDVSSNITASTLDPYKNFLTIDPANGHGTGKAIANTLRNTLGGLSFQVGYEVRVERPTAISGTSGTPRVYGERYSLTEPTNLPVVATKEK